MSLQIYGASSFALADNALKLAIRESFDGCVLKNSGGLLPPLFAFIRSHNKDASSGLYTRNSGEV